jgi:hypothetical protein
VPPYLLRGRTDGPEVVGWGGRGVGVGCYRPHHAGEGGEASQSLVFETLTGATAAGLSPVLERDFYLTSATDPTSQWALTFASRSTVEKRQERTRGWRRFDDEIWANWWVFDHGSSIPLHVTPPRSLESHEEASKVMK